MEYLWRVERPKITDEVSEAAALGDRSENAEYIYGKKRLREIDRRLQFLSQRLKVLEVVDAQGSDGCTVCFGAWVELEDEEGERLVYRLVGSDEFDISRGWISIDSPVGKAIVSKKVGQSVLVNRPRGSAELEILRVWFEEDS
jgi:transcription elongation factor GreB